MSCKKCEELHFKIKELCRVLEEIQTDLENAYLMHDNAIKENDILRGKLENIENQLLEWKEKNNEIIKIYR